MAHADREQLFDLSADPHELHNLTDEPERRTMLNDLRGQLDRWLKKHFAAPAAN